MLEVIIINMKGGFMGTLQFPFQEMLYCFCFNLCKMEDWK